MKKLILLIITWCLIGQPLLHAQEAENALTMNERISNTTEQSIPLEESLRLLEDKHDVTFIYKSVLAEGKAVPKRIVEAKDFQTALTKLVQLTNLKYEQVGDRSFLLSEETNFYRKALVQETIKGTVTDAETGKTLPGVNILVKGTSTGVSTDSEGNFELTVESLQDTLVASYIGYQTKKVPINGQTEISIELKPATITGEELVVVGYGTEQTKNVTGAVSSVDIASVDDRPITNMSQALSGQVSGVNVTQSSGQPGRDGARIRIRGIGTLNNASPLVLVDGVPSSLSGLNPSNIANITVLKDAASAAIYGSRAANGVILVTTKKGGGKKLRVQYHGYAGLQKPARLMDMIFDMPTHMRLLNKSKTNIGLAPQFPQEEIKAWESHPNAPIKYPNTNWFDWAFRGRAPVTNHTISVTGGSELLNYYLAGGYLMQDGLLDVTGKTRYDFRLNTEAEVSSDVTVGTNLYAYWQEVEGAYNVMFRFRDMASSPGVVVKHNGRYGGAQAVGEGFVGNPAAPLQTNERTAATQYILGKLYADWEILENLTLEANGSIKLNNRRNRSFSPGYLLWNFRTDEATRGNLDNITLSVSDDQDRTLTFNTLLTYEREFSDHHVEALAGTEVVSFRSERFQSRIEKIYSENTPVLNAGSNDPTVGGNIAEWALLSYFGRLSYNYQDRYLLKVSTRYDGSSRFREGYRWGFFPSISAGWRVSEEPFFPENSLINNLKLRASWGTLGNQQIGTYPYQSVYRLGLYYNFGGKLVQGAAQTELANNDIQWETTRVINAGIDLGMFDGRLNLTANYFDKRTSDILVRLPIPLYLGAKAAPFQNIGVMENSGWEASLSYDGAYNGFKYGFGVNLTHVSNVVSNYKGETPSINGPFIIREGLPYQSIYGYKVLGLFQSKEEVKRAAEQGSLTAPGDLRYADLSGDGKIGPEDRTVIGSTIPELSYGFHINLGYKGFQLSTSFEAIGGVNRYLTGDNIVPFNNGDRGLAPAFWLNAWTPENQNTNIPRLTNPAYYSWNYKISEFWMQDGAFLRMKSIQLGYTLPSSWTQSLGVQNLRVYFNGQNLLTVTDFRGYDPERSLTATQMGYPIPETYTLGVQMSF